ncbi:GIY-YIG catalytic domain [Dehalogenimonas alkenigignens]|uniref:GIY-YIG catalytic domain n=1 Tax=Dehalogenimonas alkenigignens TaxID=1217799 RepID=A0A0W0GI87_9CHLR|nr:hypothetical protein [Dehalogenimonas alkenigignens]KTB48254.1 GIY-YIG catalytic domain [Dehalogenimonas alkenigignens]
MEWCKIDWKGYYSIGAVKTKAESLDDFGIYAIYETTSSAPQKLLYIGETYWQTFGKRLRQHEREWLDKVKGKLLIAFGTVTLPEGNKISQSRIFDVECSLIDEYRPPYNTIGKCGYDGRHLVIFNSGKIGTLDKIVSTDREFLKLLKKHV